MKIYFGKPKDQWLSPYTIMGWVLFWRKGDVYDITPPVALAKFCDALFAVRKFFFRDVEYIRIDGWDTWSVDYTLSRIAVPLLKQLKQTKHGAPCVDDEDVPAELRSTTKEAQEAKVEEYDVDGNHFKRWDYVLDEMIWAHEQIIDNGGDSKFFDHSLVDSAENIGTQIQKIEVDREGLDAHHARISKGLVLFGKYYRALWD